MKTIELIDTTTRNTLQFPADARVAVSTHTGIPALGEYQCRRSTAAPEDRGVMTVAELADRMRAFAETDAGPWYQRAWYVANEETSDHWRVELPA